MSQIMYLQANFTLSTPVVPNRWVVTPKWAAEELLWGREQQPQWFAQGSNF